MREVGVLSKFARRGCLVALPRGRVGGWSVPGRILEVVYQGGRSLSFLTSLLSSRGSVP